MSGPTLVDLLRKTEIFGTMSREELNALLRVLERRKVPQGGILYSQGARGDSLAVVAYGGLDIEFCPSGEAPISVGILGVGDVVGELSCVDPAPRSATVRATRDSGVLELDRKMLQTIQQNYPKIGARIIGGISNIVCARIRETNEKVVQIVQNLLDARHRQAGGSQSVGVGREGRREKGSSGFHRSSEPPHYPLDQKDLQLLSSVGVARTLTDGEILCEEGDPGDSAYFLTAGHLDVLRMVSGSPRLLATIPMGGVVGQLALLDQRERSATLRARGPVRVVGLNRDTFLNLIERSNSFALRFQEHVCVTGIRQLRSATQLLSKIESVMEDQARKVESGEQEDIKLSYVSAVLDELNMTIDDLDEVVVKTPEGQLTAAEIRARNLAG